MAKSQGGNEDRAKVKLRVIEFELEGGNASVENSIRQLTHALTVRNGQVPPAKSAPAPRQVVELAEPEPAEEYVEEPEVLETNAEDDGSTKGGKPRTKSTYKPPLPNYLHDL